jgi:hypothetical protein
MQVCSFTSKNQNPKKGIAVFAAMPFFIALNETALKRPIHSIVVNDDRMESTWYHAITY